MLRYAGRDRSEGDHREREHRNGTARGAKVSKDDDPTTPKSAATTADGNGRTAANGMF